MRYTMTQIQEATNFNGGDVFKTEQEVRDYFTVAAQRECFGADATLTQDELDAMASEVIANRWHMVEISREDKLRGVCSANKGSRITGQVKADLDRFDWAGFYPYVNTDGELTGEIANQSTDDFYHVCIREDGTPFLDDASDSDAAVSMEDAEKMDGFTIPQ